jgi:hypothetical protein
MSKLKLKLKTQMLDKFEQKHLFGKRELELYEGEVRVRITHFIVGKVEHSIKLSEINNTIDYRRINYTDRGCLVVGLTYFLVFILLSAGLNFEYYWSILVISIFVIWAIMINKFLGDQYLEIKTKNEPIKIHVNRWTMERGKIFLEKIIDQSREYLRSKYMFVDKDLGFESQVENYRWLMINDVISKEEYESLKLELKKLKGVKE